MAKKKYIETPEKMWELFQAYRKEVKENPRVIYDFVGRDGNEVAKRLERPLTIEGFKNYARKHAGCIHDYLLNKDNRYDEYATICHALKEEIRQDQIEGGMVGQYNPSITQRLNNLKEQTESTVSQNIQILNIDPLDDSDDSLKKD